MPPTGPIRIQRLHTRRPGFDNPRLSPLQASALSSRAPNILVVMADQLTPTALPFHGNPVVQAPHLARLASEGVVFDAAYCASPLCAPARQGLLTGLLPSRFDGFDNASELPSEIPTVAHGLRAAGYRTVLAGKMHFAGPNQLHGFEERLTTDIYPADFGWTPDWSDTRRPEWYHHMGSVLEAGPCVRTNQLDFDDEVIFAAERKLHDHVRERDGRPLFMVVSLTHPHDPYVISQPHWDRYRDADIPAPAVGRDDVPDDAHSRRLRAACLMDATPPRPDQVRDARRAYYGAVSYVDDQVGRLLGVLEQTGQRDDTVVVFTSDHGDMLGERGLCYKMHFFEGAARVPLVVHAPRRLRPHRVPAAVSLLDLLPTLADLAGLAPDDELALDGRSLRPHLEGRGGHDEAVAEYLGEIAEAPIAMLRRGRFKFIHSPADPPLLFDLAADPQERHNLATRPSHRDQVGALVDEMTRRWDFDRLAQRVRLSQRRRRQVFAAESRGRRHSWDWSPPVDASRQYVRSHLPLDDIEAMARFPSLQRRSP